MKPTEEQKYLIEQAKTRHKDQTTLRCEEAAPQSSQYYIPCGRVATRFILSERGRVVYAMCTPCASHNAKNRSCQDLGPVEQAAETAP
jgi:hypothetical protein